MIHIASKSHPNTPDQSFAAMRADSMRPRRCSPPGISLPAVFHMLDGIAERFQLEGAQYSRMTAHARIHRRRPLMELRKQPRFDRCKALVEVGFELSMRSSLADNRVTRGLLA